MSRSGLVNPVSAGDRYGKTWWGQAFLGAVNEIIDLAGPTGTRGREAAVRGQVGELNVEPGRVTASVARGPGRHVDAELTVERFTDPQWKIVLDTLAAEVRVTGALAEDRLVDDLEALLRPHELGLLPRRGELALSPTENGSPTPVAVAMALSLTAAIDADPWLLFVLRGRDRRSVAAGFRARRAGTDTDEAVQALEEAPDAIEVTSDDAFRTARSDLARILIHPERAEHPEHLVESLGEPPRMDDTRPLVRLLERAADTAWKIAAGEGQDSADDELLLAELRAQRMATAGKLADALGWEVERTRGVLDRLFEEGTVLRTGKGDSTRYRA